MRQLTFWIRTHHRIDIIKLDIEGYEHAALPLLLCAAPGALLPGAIIIEDSRDRWQSDLIARLVRAGYRICHRGGLNLILARDEFGVSKDPPAPASNGAGKSPESADFG